MASSMQRSLAALALLALVPVATFLVSRSDARVLLSAVCVALIAGSLYSMFSPGEGGEVAGATPSE